MLSETTAAIQNLRKRPGTHSEKDQSIGKAYLPAATVPKAECARAAQFRQHRTTELFRTPLTYPGELPGGSRRLRMRKVISDFCLIADEFVTTPPSGRNVCRRSTLIILANDRIINCRRITTGGQVGRPIWPNGAVGR